MTTRENEGMMPVTVMDATDDLMSVDYDNMLMVAERADKMVDAMNKIMRSAIRITKPKDWVIIGGTPYLQESGATKVARLFGISWRILDQHAEYDKDGYPTYFYRMEFVMGKNTIESEGSRCSKDDFFAGRNKKKSPDEVDIRDVRMAAFTNCINNGIKRILPGLRNIDIKDLEENGIHGVNGYTFKEGSHGGKTKEEAAEGLVCSNCGAAVSQKVASYSQAKYGAILCMNCQRNVGQEDGENANG